MKFKKILKGVVINKLMNKTLVVLITRIVKHKIYGKFIKKVSKIYVHYEKDICNKNDVVEIKQCRPLSKKKCWILNKVIINNI